MYPNGSPIHSEMPILFIDSPTECHCPNPYECNAFPWWSQSPKSLLPFTDSHQTQKLWSRWKCLVPARTKPFRSVLLTCCCSSYHVYSRAHEALVQSLNHYLTPAETSPSKKDGIPQGQNNVRHLLVIPAMVDRCHLDPHQPKMGNPSPPALFYSSPYLSHPSPLPLPPPPYLSPNLARSTGPWAGHLFSKSYIKKSSKLGSSSAADGMNICVPFGLYICSPLEPVMKDSECLSHRKSSCPTKMQHNMAAAVDHKDAGPHSFQFSSNNPVNNSCESSLVAMATWNK